MEVLLESEEQMGQNKQKGKGRRKRQRPAGPPAASPAVVAAPDRAFVGRVRRTRAGSNVLPPTRQASPLWNSRSHEQTRRQADLYVAGLLAKASEQAETARHIDDVINGAEAPLRPAEKKTPLGGAASGRTGGHGDDAVYCSHARGRTGKGRGPEGSGLYPELAAYRITEGCSPNVQAEVRSTGRVCYPSNRRERS